MQLPKSGRETRPLGTEAMEVGAVEVVRGGGGRLRRRAVVVKVGAKEVVKAALIAGIYSDALCRLKRDGRIFCKPNNEADPCNLPLYGLVEGNDSIYLLCV